MAELTKGTLFFDGVKRKWQVEFFNAKKDKQSKVDCDMAQISTDIGKKEDEKYEIEFEREPRYGHPLQVRLVGQDFKPSVAANVQPVREAPDYNAARQRDRERQQPNRRDNRQRDYRQDRNQQQNVNAMSKEFHNPYNFIPAPDREGIRGTTEEEKKLVKELRDREPSGHDCYHSDLFSGKLRVNLTVETPLLIPDTARVTLDLENAEDPKDAHKSFPLRIGLDGKPLLPVTSVKGMLRSAYEAVTNSRLSVFSQHDERLGFRMEATEGARMVPVRIEGKPGHEKIVFYTGTSELYEDGRPFNESRETNRYGEPRNGLLCAAWLPMYTTEVRGDRERSWWIDDVAKRPVDDRTRLPKHGEPIFAWVEEEDRSPSFKRWRVRKLATKKASLLVAPNGIKEIEGYVCNTGQNIDRKHDEKIFFKDASNPLPINDVKLTQSLRDAWDALIKNYRTEHDNGSGGLKDPPTATWHDRRPGQTEDLCLEWSRHIQRTDAKETELNAELEAEKLKDGTLCYARVKQIKGSDFEVLELIPVIISRRMHKHSPSELLGQKLHPAQTLAELSTADRVFGWVRQPKSKFRKIELSKEEKERAAYRGQLRIGTIECKTNKEKAIRYLTNDAELQDKELGLPLAILGAPKPQQGRFYVAKNKQGEAHPRVLNSERGLNNEQAGYNDIEKGLRGRKVYPRHTGLTKEYWQPKWQEGKKAWQADGQNRFQEYIRPKKKSNQTNQWEEQRDNQNRSVRAWVEKGTTFEVDINFTNLSSVELGALLWLLRLNAGKREAGHFCRLGGGKPLGFGSVAMELLGCDVRDGAAWREYYESWGANACEPAYKSSANLKATDARNSAYTNDEAGLNKIVEAYQIAVRSGYAQGARSFEQVSFIAAFLRAATGFVDTGLPIHYPRADHYTEPDEPQTEPTHPLPPHIEGLAYEWFVANNREASRRYALPDLEKDQGLPLFWHKKKRT